MAYKAPGVYSTEQANPAFATLPAGIRVAGIVASANSFNIVRNTEVVKGASGATDTIPGTTSTDTQNVIAISDNPDGETYLQYTPTTDFININNTIDWSPGGSEPTTGATYYVTWRKNKSTTATPTYYEPTTYYSVDSVRTAFGDELVGGIINPMTTAASLAFSNGATAVVCVQSETGSNTHLQAALDKLKSEEVNVIIMPQATNTTLRNYVKTHVDSQSGRTERHERVAIVGPDGLSDTVTVVGGLAETLGDERIILVSPPSVEITLEDSTYDTEVTNLLPSTYLAAALAGIMTNPNYDVAEPITRKEVIGIDKLQTGISGREHKYYNSEMNTLGSKGVCVFGDDAGTISVRHGLTTDLTNVNTQTISVVTTKDYVIQALRTSLENAYVGTKITDTTSLSMKATMRSVLDNMKPDILVDYTINSVVQNSADPRQMDVNLAISVVYPLEFTELVFSLYVA